jgi:hypothetical protein
MHSTWTLRTCRLAVALVALTTIAAGCSSGGDDSSAGGWLDGSPADASADREVAGSGAERRGGATAERATAAATADDSSASAPVVPPTDRSRPGLRAGSVDDNEDFAGYLSYRQRADRSGVASRELDVSVRHVVEVVGDDGRPVLGEQVEVLLDGKAVGSVRTGTDGRAYVHPRAMGVAQGRVTLRVAGDEWVPDSNDPSAPVTVTLDGPGGVAAPIPLDVFFVLDATGSMGDELDRLTATVDSVVERITALDGDPDVRLGVTVYRDEGDAFLNRTFDFTDDVGRFRDALAEVEAGGGGDDPEALDEALAAALDEPSWRDPGEAVQLVFVVADAPPQVGRVVPTPYDESLREAATRGIRIHSVGASGSSDGAEYALRQFAQFTGGRFVFLSYGVGGAALGPSTDIASVDYEELPLEDVLVRLVAESLADLTGGEVTVPPASTTTTTDPRQRQGG